MLRHPLSFPGFGQIKIGKDKKKIQIKTNHTFPQPGSQAIKISCSRSSGFTAQPVTQSCCEPRQQRDHLHRLALLVHREDFEDPSSQAALEEVI